MKLLLNDFVDVVVVGELLHVLKSLGTLILEEYFVRIDVLHVELDRIRQLLVLLCIVNLVQQFDLVFDERVHVADLRYLVDILLYFAILL